MKLHLFLKYLTGITTAYSQEMPVVIKLLKSFFLFKEISSDELRTPPAWGRSFAPHSPRLVADHHDSRDSIPTLCYAI